MDAINVFVINETNIFGILVPFGCKYFKIVDLITNKLMFDNEHVSYKTVISISTEKCIYHSYIQ